jgi:trigger factor
LQREGREYSMALTIEVKNGGPCRKVLQVQADWDAIANDYEQVLDAFVRQAEIPGFRRGKAPRGVVDRRYQKAVVDETRDRLVGRLYNKAIEQEHLHPLAIVDMGDISFKKGESFAMKVTVDIPPDFTLPHYRKIPVNASPISVSDADFDAEYRRFLDRFARFEEVTTGRPVARGDLVLVDYAGSCEGKALEALSTDCRDVASGRDAWVLVDDPEFLPGFAEGIAGMKVGENKTLPVAFPADYHVRGVAGKQASYSVTVKQVREKHATEVNEAFLKQAGADSEETLKKRLRSEMMRTVQEQDLNQRREQIARYLLAETKLDVPPSVVEQEMKLTVRNMVRHLVSQGGTREQIAEHRASIMDAATRTSLDRVKLGYILSRIAEEERVEISEAEVDERLAKMAPQLNLDADQVRAVLEKKEGMERLRAEMREEKAMAILMDQAKIKE